MMTNRNKNLENNLRDEKNDLLEDYISNSEKIYNEKEEEYTRREGGRFKRFLVVFLIVFGGFFIAKNITNFTFNPITMITNTVGSSGPSTDLLDRMNNRLVDMGYVGLNHDDLRELRRMGVTASYVTNIRALGYPDLTLEQAVLLAQSNASTSFMAMMIELGYTPTIEDFIQLRTAGVTAHYASNVHDLGYRDVPLEQLIRMQRIGVSISLIERLQAEQGSDISMDEIIRYRISNQ